MKIYLIRHGQTTGDLEDRYGGDYDDCLTDAGKKQAENLGDKLKGVGIEIVFTSPLLRAKETAEILGHTFGCQVRIIEDMRERNMYGVLTGMVKSEAKKQHSDFVEQLKEHDHRVPGSEEYGRFRTRITNALDILSSNPDYHTIAIVSHGGPISFIFREILKYGNVEVEDCGYAELEKTESGFAIKKLDGIAMRP